MQRFVLEQNLLHFKKLVSQSLDERDRRSLQSLITVTQRELAILMARTTGALKPIGPQRPIDARFTLQDFQTSLEYSNNACVLLDPRAGLHIVQANQVYAQAALTDPNRIVGQRLFDIFPDNPDDPNANGVSNLYKSLQIVAQYGHAHVMDLQRYDIRDSNGVYVERYWRPRNVPVFDNDGRLRFVLHEAEDVTEAVLNETTQKRAVSAA